MLKRRKTRRKIENLLDQSFLNFRGVRHLEISYGMFSKACAFSRYPTAFAFSSLGRRLSLLEFLLQTVYMIRLPDQDLAHVRLILVNFFPGGSICKDTKH